MIDVGSLARTGKAVAVGAATAHAGAQGAAVMDEGVFRESLKASVGAALLARAGVPVSSAVTAGEAVLGVAVKKAVPVVDVPSAGDSVQTVAASMKGMDAAGGGSKVVVSAPPVADEGAVVAAPAVGTVPVPLRSAAALEVGVEAKLVESAPVVPAGAAKDSKIGLVTSVEGAGGKKVAGKSLEKVGAAPPVEVPAANETVAAAAVVAVVQVQAAGLLVPVVAAEVSEPHVQAPATEVSGSGKIAKVGAPVAAVKVTGRDAKKVEAVAVVAGKAEVGVAAASGHFGGKEAVAAAPAQGVGAVAPVSVAASHAGLTGAAGGKVAASVEAVSTAGVQGAGPGSAQDAGVKTLAATPNLLEVGIDGGTHGWLRVRAELGQTGEVTASMVATSAGQADTLRRELPAMSTYLAGESVGVSSLVVNAAGGAAGAQDAAMSLGAGAQQGTADGRAQGGGAGAQGAGAGGGTGGSEGGGSGLEFGGAELPAAVYANGSGSWLSVRV